MTSKARLAKRGHRRIGRPSLIHNHDIVTAILTAVEDGCTITAAAALAGVSVDAVYVWNARGLAEADRRHEHWPQPCDTCGDHDNTPQHRGHSALPQAHDEEPFVQFADALARARASVEREYVGVIRESIKGGFVTKDVVRTERSGDVVEEKTYAAPDGKLALEFLARTRPRDYGKINSPIQAEITGPGGGPIQTSDQALAPLAARVLAALEAQQADRAAIEAGTDVQATRSSRVIDAEP